MAKIFTFRGKTEEELKALSTNELLPLLDSRTRRSLNRGYTDAQKIFLKDVENGKKKLKTHCRDLVILPNLLGLTIGVHNGKEFVDVLINAEMIGHRLGEFSQAKKRAMHSQGKKKK